MNISKCNAKIPGRKIGAISASLIALLLSACASKPVELPQAPFKYNKEDSTALHFAKAMGINAIDLPKGKAEALLKEREETLIERGLSASLSSYVVSFGFAKALGLPTSFAKSTAKNIAEDSFILGAMDKKEKTARDYNQMAVYLPFEMANSKESAKQFVFDYYVNVFTNMGMKLEDLESEFKYGFGNPFQHPVCETAEAQCRYKIMVKEPVIGYAPEKLGGYKAWVWSIPSRNSGYVMTYNIGTFKQIASLDMDTIKKNELLIQDTFQKPLLENHPDWIVLYFAPTYSQAPYIMSKGVKYKFEKPNHTK